MKEMKVDELRTTTDLVKHILESSPKARNSDNYLYYKVLQYIGSMNGIDIEHMPVLIFFLKMKEYKIPSIETVGRCRRKIVETHPELAGTDDVENGRMLNEEVFREYARKW